MKTLRVVKLANDKYAVQVQKAWLGGWDFCESNHDHCVPGWGRTWGPGSVCPEHVVKYCMIDTLEDAEMVLKNAIAAFTESLNKEKSDSNALKVVKVIRKVKV